MYEALINFYKFGFIIFKKVPTENNFITRALDNDTFKKDISDLISKELTKHL